ncbi:hypothetical protein [Endozoicomonas arenosclerae]|nr:hypothetical protein [Endozoicomonas arenosclerae]
MSKYRFPRLVDGKVIVLSIMKIISQLKLNNDFPALSLGLSHFIGLEVRK